ncbi:GDSL-type esterase/lipase family protein [uncultured Kiloniella sp.]|uniref:GDSL-type esterase/lipase family protein n=1 Tax=uncultured Kiloniella sp. TaxID=1133091 RepID=UPI002617996E|nr:GDSL-type esterase/lipase family protein [uncultured Kiloniella sp.]
MKRVCFLGASVMEGMGDEARLGMPGRLALLEAETKQSFIHYNLGVRGQTLKEISERAASECRARFKSAKDFIVFATGSNDFALIESGIAKKNIPRTPRRRAMNNFKALMTELSEIAPLLVFGPTPVDESKLPFFSTVSNMHFDFKNEELASGSAEYGAICQDMNIPFINMHEALSTSDDFMAGLAENDGLHSTGKGYQAMAEIVQSSPHWQGLLQA